MRIENEEKMIYKWNDTIKITHNETKNSYWTTKSKKIE